MLNPYNLGTKLHGLTELRKTLRITLFMWPLSLILLPKDQLWMRISRFEK